MPYYSDYFALQAGYHAVISKHSIEDANSRWQDTYPHQTFVELLKKTARMLERPDGKNDAKKPIWIHGIYGTGKSRVAWTLGELLTCQPVELEAYFEEYRELKNEIELRQKLLGVKLGDRIVVAMRFSSGEIQGIDDLVMAVYQSVCEAMEKRGFNSLAEKSLVGAILQWLEDPVNQNILTQILGAEPYCHDGNLPSSGADVAAAFKLPGPHEGLLRAIMRMARERHIIALAFNIDTLCAWLREVIDKNELKAIVFIWDEFSDFLMNNRGIFGELQKLAQFSTAAPFYLLIVTHQSESLFVKDDPAGRVIMDRFHTQPISLPDYTAFKLIGHALKVRPGMEKEWNELRGDLNDRLEEARREVSRIVPGLDEEAFKDILPIHPFAALILKNVATLFDSNQRSMFKFIAVEDEDAHAFQWFIHNFDPNSKELLGVDRLWDYFYTSGKGKLGAGRENLTAKAREILESYALVAGKYAGTDEVGNPVDTIEQRVLKTIIIMQALRAVSPSVKFFAATKENLETAFNGLDELENGHGVSIADTLVRAKVLFIDSDIYQVPMGNAVDSAAMCKQIDKVRESTTTRDMISGFDPWEVLPAQAALACRMIIRKATASDFKKELNRLVGEEGKSWRIKVIMLFARSPQEADRVRELMKEALADPRASNIYFIDAANVSMLPEQFEELATALGRQNYFASKDEAQAQHAKRNAENLLRDWQRKIASGKFALYGKDFPDGKIAPNGDDLVARLKELVLRLYPGCCDFMAGVVDTHFRTPNINAIKAGLAGGAGGTITKLQADQLLANVRVENYWELLPDHPLARLRMEIGRKAARAFAPQGSGRMAISEIVDVLLEKGFMPTVLSGYFTGFLLKEFATREYRYSDGETGDVMTPDRLAEMIRAYFQKLNNPGLRYQEQYIEVLTRDQKAFADLAGKLFKLEGNESLEKIAISAASIIRDWGYPLWVLNELPEAMGLEDYINNFCRYFTPHPSGASGYGEIATLIGSMIRKNAEAEPRLQGLFSQQNLEDGMRAWLGRFADGRFNELVEEIHVEDPLRDVRRSFGGDGAWLWNRETGEEAIASLMRGYGLAALSVRNGFITHARSREECLANWKLRLGQLHLPVAVLLERYPDQKTALGILRDLAKNGVLPGSREDKLYEIMAGSPTRLRDALDNARDTFKAVYASLLSSLGEADKNSLYDRLPASSFTEDRNNFESDLKVKIAALASGLKRGRLCQLWRQKTDTATPARLSARLRTPLGAILLELGDSAFYARAMAACSALDDSGADEKKVDAALAFWTENDAIFDKLTDPAVADSAFADIIIGARRSILKDPELVRAAFAAKFGDNVHAWLDNPQWSECVEELARQEYKKYGSGAVTRKIEAMDAETARKLLLELGRDNFAVGMKILAE